MSGHATDSIVNVLTFMRIYHRKTRRYATEDPTKRNTQGAMEVVPNSISPYMEEMRRQPAKKRKRVEETEFEGNEDRPSGWSVRLWGARLYASIATTNRGITRVKEFVPTSTGEIGEMEASGKVKKGDVIWKINDTIVTGMPSAEFMNLIRGTPRPIQLWFMRPDTPVTSDPPLIEPHPTRSNAIGVVSSLHSQPIVAKSITAPSQSAAIVTVSSSSSKQIETQAILPPSGPVKTSAVTVAQSAHPPAVEINSEQIPVRGDLSFTVPQRKSVQSASYQPQANVQRRMEASDTRNIPSLVPSSYVHPPLANHFVNRNGTYQQANHVYPSGYLTPQHGVPSSMLTNMQFNGTRQHQVPVAQQFNNSFQFRQLPWGNVANATNATMNNQQNVIGQHRYPYQQNQTAPVPTNTITQLSLQAPQSIISNSGSQGVTWSTQRGFGGTYNLHSSNAVLQSRGAQMNAYANPAPTQSMNHDANQLSTDGQQMYNSPTTQAHVLNTGQPSSQLQKNNQSPQARVFTSEQRSPPSEHEQHSPRLEIQRNANAIRHAAPNYSQQLQQRSTPDAVQAGSTSNTVHASEPTQTIPRSGDKNFGNQDPDAHTAEDQVPKDASSITLDDEDLGETSFLSLGKPSFVAALPESAPERGHPVPTPRFPPRSMTGNYVIVRIMRKRLQVTLGMVGSRVAVTSFVRDENGNIGEIEESGKVVVGDCVVAVNGAPILQNSSPTEVARLVVSLPRPFDLYFQRVSWDALHG